MSTADASPEKVTHTTIALLSNINCLFIQEPKLDDAQEDGSDKEESEATG